MRQLFHIKWQIKQCVDYESLFKIIIYLNELIGSKFNVHL